MKQLLTYSVLALGFIACAKSQSPLVQAPAVHYQSVKMKAGVATIVDPKVNILFVVDNSGSMNGHQETLRRNIDTFAQTFFKNPRIDYRIGVVPVYDSVYKDGQAECATPGAVRKMNKYAELIALKNPDGSLIPNVAPYITRDTPNGQEVLKKTVILGTQCGPEAEESFSPVLGVIDPSINQTKNAGFYEKDAYLVVIFLTDADDATPGLSASQFYESLLAAKGGNREKILIAAALPDPQKASAACTIDGQGPISAFPELVSIAGVKRLNLCSSTFGTELAKFGQNLVNRVALQTVALPFRPDINIRVSYGTDKMAEQDREVIPMNANNGFGFSPGDQEIVLFPGINVKRVPGGQIYIEATPLNEKGFDTGRTTTVGTPTPTPAPKASKKK